MTLSQILNLTHQFEFLPLKAAGRMRRSLETPTTLLLRVPVLLVLQQQQVLLLLLLVPTRLQELLVAKSR